MAKDVRQMLDGRLDHEPLLGELDSLDLVQLMVGLETDTGHEGLAARLAATIGQPDGPLTTVGSLITYIEAL